MTETEYEAGEGRYEAGGWKLDYTSSSSTDMDALIAEHIMGLVPGKDFGDLGEHQWEDLESSEYNQYYCPKCHLTSQDWARKVEGIDPAILAKPCYLAPPTYTEYLPFAYDALQRLIADAHVNVEIERFLGDWDVRLTPSEETVSHVKQARAWHPDLAAAIGGALVSWIESQRYRE